MRSYEEFRQLFPSLYVDCAEVNTFSIAQYEMLLLLNQEFLHVRDRQFILTADSAGLAEYEKIFKIPIDLTEDLEFRRQSILARLQTLPPFTFNYLKMRLDEFVGPGLWNAYIDFDNYTLYIESYLQQKWYHEFQVMMNMIKPANIVFVNSPVEVSLLQIQDEVRMSAVEWNYILGSWGIDESTPFAYYDDGEVIKMASERSISDFALNRAAFDFLERLHHVVLTGGGQSTTIYYFQERRATSNVAVIGYLVEPENIALIEHISVQDVDNNEMLGFDADITVLVDNLIKHTIPVQEVLDNAV